MKNLSAYVFTAIVLVLAVLYLRVLTSCYGHGGILIQGQCIKVETIKL